MYKPSGASDTSKALNIGTLIIISIDNDIAKHITSSLFFFFSKKQISAATKRKPRITCPFDRKSAIPREAKTKLV